MKNEWIQTFSGIQFWPLEPMRGEILIQDIAHSLSMQCRFGGHSKRFYSVAEHCCHVCDILPDEHKIAGILHDASEAYLCDIPRPIKRSGMMIPYVAAESALMCVIARKYGFEWPLNSSVKDADDSVLRSEIEEAMTGWGDEQNYTPVKNEVMIKFWPPNIAETQFMSRCILLGLRYNR